MDHQSAVDRNLAERYLLGELEAAEAAEFEEHFFDCPACAEDVRMGRTFVANLKAVLVENTLIEIGADDRFVELTIEVNAASAACQTVQCELRPAAGAAVDLRVSPSKGRIRILLAAARLHGGAWTLILRDADSGHEVDRRRLHITKKSTQ